MNKILKVYYFLFKSWSNIRIIFITSSGRTGTNFMAGWFEKYSNDILSLHEPQPDLFYLGVNKYRKRLRTWIIKNKIKWYRVEYLYKLNKLKKNIYIESNPNCLLLLSELKKLFPQMKIVFIQRDIKSYVLSALNKSPDKSNINFFYGDNDPRKRITAIDVNDIFAEYWSKMSREEHIAWWWQYSDKLIKDFVSNNNYGYVVNYEDLFVRDTKNTVMGIINFLELPININHDLLEQFKKPTNVNNKKIVFNWHDIPEETRNKILAIKSRKTFFYD